MDQNSQALKTLRNKSLQKPQTAATVGSWCATDQASNLQMKIQAEERKIESLEKDIKFY